MEFMAAPCLASRPRLQLAFHTCNWNDGDLSLIDLERGEFDVLPIIPRGNISSNCPSGGSINYILYRNNLEYCIYYDACESYQAKQWAKCLLLPPLLAASFSFSQRELEYPAVNLAL